MKTFSFPLNIILTLFLVGSAEAGMVTAHDLSVTLQPEQHALRGTSTLFFNGTGTEFPQVRLNPDCNIASATVNGAAVPFGYKQGVVTLDLSEEARARKQGEAVITYSCRFNDPLPEQYAGSEDPTYGIEGVIAPQGTFLGAGLGWYPRPADGLPPLKITVTAPAGSEAVTAGRRLEHGIKGGESVSVWEIREPLPGISLSVGPYRIEERRVGDIPVYTYFYPENGDLAARYLEGSATYLADYQKKFGPYPFPKFAVVDNFFPSGYGFPSYTLIGSSVLRLPFIVTTSLPHEIAHNWWGNGVDVDLRHGNWSEGLVTYLADYLQESAGSAAGAAGYRFRLLAEFAAVVPPEKDFPLKNFQSRTDAVSRAVGYGKGAMVFHMVHHLVGDEAFYSGLRSVVKEKLFQEAGWEDFGRAFSRSSGKDITSFLSQWLARPGGARLSLQRVERQRAENGWLVRGVIVQEAPEYSVPVTVRAETARGPHEIQLAVAGPETPFSLTVPAEPTRVTLDPEYHLFRLLDRSEIPVTVNRLKGARSLRVIVTNNCRADRETLRHLVTSLGQPTAPLSPEGVPAQDGEDVLYCGFPGGAALPRLPAGVVPARDSFTIEEKRFTGAGSALFLTLGGKNDERVVSLFLPLSGEAAREVAGKITHYGKYSYLVFENGKNLAKGVFPAGPGRGSFDF